MDTLFDPGQAVVPPATGAGGAMAIRIRALTKRFDDRTVLRGIDLDVRPGEMFALLGPNGAGKSTLFSILCTLRKPTSGTVSVLGRDVVREQAAVRGRIGIVFQDPALAQQLSVRDNLALMGRLYGLSGHAARARTDAVARQLQLEDIVEQRVSRLSGGQRRRVELGRALMPDPALLCLDEATLGLDIEARRRFWAGVAGLVELGRTVFFTTHYMQEAEVASRIAMIDGGRIVALDTPARLKARAGGGRIHIETDDDARALAWLKEQRIAAASGQAGLVVTEDDPGRVLPLLLRHIPVRVERVEIREPSLEDAFFHLTGHHLDNGRRAGVSPAGDS
jgi:ABC-2 type transport system ATP-binding protein